jgi:hypothetical protein
VDFLSAHGLIGMPLRGHLAVIDDVLEPDVRSAAERRKLLLDHELLAATAELHLMLSFMVEDDDGQSYLALKDGEWAWDIYTVEDFLEYLQEECPRRLGRLTGLIRKALFHRLQHDAMVTIS